MPLWLIIVLVVIALLIIVFLVVGYQFFNTACSSSTQVLDDHQDEGASPWNEMEAEHKKDMEYFSSLVKEDCYIDSVDGLHLHAVYVPAENTPRRIILCAHGYKGSPMTDFGRASRWLHSDCNMFLIDERCCGESEGTYITYGAMEKTDVLRWMEYLEKKNTSHLPIYLYGISLGCATVLMTADHHYSKDVKGILADCGYSSMYDILASLANRWMHLPSWPLVSFIGFWCKVKGHFDMKEADAAKALKNATVPVIFFHGTKDEFVLMENSDKNYQACSSEKEMVKIEGAAHAISLNVDPDTYISKAEAFFAKNDHRN